MADDTAGTGARLLGDRALERSWVVANRAGQPSVISHYAVDEAQGPAAG